MEPPLVVTNMANDKTYRKYSEEEILSMELNLLAGISLSTSADDKYPADATEGSLHLPLNRSRLAN